MNKFKCSIWPIQVYQHNILDKDIEFPKFDCKSSDKCCHIHDALWHQWKDFRK